MSPNVLIFGSFATSVVLIVACVMALRWWRRRNQRRSPLQNRRLDAGNVPGQQLVERASDSQEEALLSVNRVKFPDHFSATTIFAGRKSTLTTFPRHRIAIESSMRCPSATRSSMLVDRISHSPSSPRSTVVLL